MERKLGAAVIGLGMMGVPHARIWSELPETELRAVYDIDPERTRRVSEEYGLQPCTSLEAALNTPGVDLVSVCTADQAHVDACVQAARAGKHVLVEKPLATTVEDADTIIEACQSQGVKLMVGHVVRFDARYQVARQAIEAGEVGEIIQVYARRNNWLSSGERIGPRTSVTFFLGCHDLDLMRWFCGSDVKRLYAESASKALAHLGVEDSIFTVMKFANGAAGCLETCWALPNSQPSPIDARLEVVGTRGRVAVAVGGDEVEITGADGARRPDYTYGPLIHDRQYGALRAELEHFARCIVTDEEPLITPADARAAVELCVAIHRSLAAGQPVVLS